MTLRELLPALQELSKVDKLLAIEFLSTELVKEEQLINQAEYPVYTPYGCEDAAIILMETLKRDV